METIVSNELDHIACVWKIQHTKLYECRSRQYQRAKNVITTKSEAIKAIVRIDKRLSIAWDFKMVAIRM